MPGWHPGSKGTAACGPSAAHGLTKVPARALLSRQAPAARAAGVAQGRGPAPGTPTARARWQPPGPAWGDALGRPGSWGVSTDPAGARIPRGWRKAEPVPRACNEEFSPAFYYDISNKTGAYLPPRGPAGTLREPGGLQGSGGSAELPRPHRRQGVCIFTGGPESVILLRAERLIQLSCYMANPASRSAHYPIAGGGSPAPPGTGVTVGVSGPFTLPAGSPGAPTASPAPPESLGIAYHPGSPARLCGLL